MLAADGGGGGGGTLWESKTVDTMLQLIRSADTDKHYDLLTGWKRSADLINEHRWQVQNYRDNLAAAWPPEKNAAAAAYVARLDELINNLDETYEAAIANHDAFATATLSISLAQRDMQKIADEYTANQQLLQNFAAKQQEKQNSPTPAPSPSPSGGDHPPVAPGRQEELHRQAVTLLSGVSGELATAQMSIRTPPLYKRSFLDDTTKSNSTDFPEPPPIPPITPSFPSGGSSGGASSRSSITFPTGTGPVPPPPSVSPIPQPGLVLGGANPLPPTASPPATFNPITPAVPNGGPTVTPALLPPGPNHGLPNKPSTLAPRDSTTVGRGAGTPRDGFFHTNPPVGSRGLPPGGVIGGVPGAGVGQSAPSRSAAQRINPVGGMIGGTTVGSRSGTFSSAAAERTAGGMPYGQASNRRTSRNDASEHEHWDPANPWQTAQGVDPVVAPAKEQRVDPGPAIGLR